MDSQYPIELKQPKQLRKAESVTVPEVKSDSPKSEGPFSGLFKFFTGGRKKEEEKSLDDI